MKSNKKLKVKPKKIRKTWQIKPVEKIHEKRGYNRQNAKKHTKKLIEEEY